MDHEASLYIGGEWTAPTTDEVIDVVSPHSEQVIGRVPAAGPGDVDRAVAAARAAVDDGPWPRLAAAERIDAVRRLAASYGERRREMASLITAEMGAPISFSKLAQASLPGVIAGSFADVAEKHPWEEVRAGYYGQDVTVRKEAVGVVAAVIPWNMPQFTIAVKLAPALLAGCAVVLKPAPETPLDSYLLAEMIKEAGIPDGVVNIVAAGRETSEYLVSHPGVDKVAFTGSTAAGRRIAAICGEQLKRCTLELGGKSAAIILDDCDLPSAMGFLSIASLMNNGQACVAQTRILASRNRYDEVVEAVSVEYPEPVSSLATTVFFVASQRSTSISTWK